MAANSPTTMELLGALYLPRLRAVTKYFVNPRCSVQNVEYVFGISIGKSVREKKHEHYAAYLTKLVELSTPFPVAKSVSDDIETYTTRHMLGYLSTHPTYARLTEVETQVPFQEIAEFLDFIRMIVELIVAFNTWQCFQSVILVTERLMDRVYAIKRYGWGTMFLVALPQQVKASSAVLPAAAKAQAEEREEVMEASGRSSGAADMGAEESETTKKSEEQAAASSTVPSLTPVPCNCKYPSPSSEPFSLKPHYIRCCVECKKGICQLCGAVIRDSNRIMNNHLPETHGQLPETPGIREYRWNQDIVTHICNSCKKVGCFESISKTKYGLCKFCMISQCLKCSFSSYEIEEIRVHTLNMC